MVEWFGIYGSYVGEPSRTEDNWTITGGIGVQAEFFGSEEATNALGSASAGTAVRYNKYTGIGVTSHAGLDFLGFAQITGTLNNGKLGWQPGKVKVVEMNEGQGKTYQWGQKYIYKNGNISKEGDYKEPNER